MLTALRKFAKSSVAAVLIGLLVVSFAVFGINDVFSGRFSTAVVVAGEREIEGEEFRRLFDNYRERLQQQAGQPLSIEDAAEQGLDRRLLEDVALSESFAELLRRIRLIASDQLVVRQLRQTPIFFNPVSGAFEQEAYQRQLAQNGLTPAQFEAYLRDDIAQQHYASALVAGLRVPRIYGALPAVLEGETRSLTFLVVDPALAGRPNPPTEAELQAFLKENAQALTRPETRTLSLVRFSAQAIAPTIQVDDAEIQRQYEFRKDALSQPERRSYVQITAPDRAAADRVAQRLRAGETPAAVAKSIGREPVSVQAQPRTAGADPAAAQAAFALQPNTVSAPFQSALGWAVVKLEQVIPAQVATLEQVRPQLEQQVRTDQAADRVLEQVQKYEDAVQGGATMTEAAKALGVSVTALPPVTQRGTDVLGNPTGVPVPLLEAAYELPVGGESDVIDGGGNEFFVLRVDRITPSALPPLDEVRVPLTQAWTLRRTVDRARERADALSKQITGARTLEQVAASANATVNQAVRFERDAGGQTLSRDLVSKAFGAKRGAVIVGEHTQLGYVVARVDAAAAPSVAEAAPAAEAQRPQITEDVFESFAGLGRAYARRTVKTRVDYERARQALGLQPAEAPDAPGLPAS